MENMEKKKAEALHEVAVEVRENLEKWEAAPPDVKRRLQEQLNQYHQREVEVEMEKVMGSCPTFDEGELEVMVKQVVDTMKKELKQKEIPLPVNRAQRRANKKKKRGEKCHT